MGITRLGKLQRGTVEPEEFGFYGFPGGLNVKAAPQLVGDDDLTIALNGYLRPDGGFQLRNGMALYGSVVATGTHPLYLARYYQGVKNGASVSPDTLWLLGVFNGNLYSIPSSGAATSIGSVGGVDNIATFVRFQNPNDPHFTSGLTDVIVICTGNGGPYVYDGVNLYTPAGWSLASGAQWCAIVNGIVWFGGIPAYPNQVFGTGDGINASMETLPAYRNFVFSSPVTGLCAQGAGATATLVMGLNNGLGVLSGTGPTTFFLQEVPFNDGVAAGRTMIYDNGVIYFLGQNAVFSYDGQTTPQQISNKVEPWILNDPLTSGYPMTTNRNLSWSAIYNNRLHIGYCSNQSTPNVILVYDLIMHGWTVLTTQPGLACMTLLDAPNDPDPYVCLAGSATTGQVYTWDYLSSSSGVVTDAGVTVLAHAQSKYFKVGVPGTSKTLLRYYPEFQIAGYFDAGATVSTDYGNNFTASTVLNPGATLVTGVWDVTTWDFSVWDGVFSEFTAFNAPTTRCDFNAQGDAFAFGVLMNTSLAPWIWSGGTGVLKQGGRV